MHSKVHHNDSQEELLRVCGGQLARLLDRESALVKAASTGAFTREEVEAQLPDKQHFAVHYIGMGDQERFSFNKNGDGWPGKDLQKRAHTFVSHGHYFREHRNRDPKLAIGTIKAAKYDPEMGRVEIIVWGHKKKAEQEYELAKSGKELSCSMSARVAKDVCSICHNEAASPRHYCTHLKNHMGRWMDEHQKYAFALNPNPTFFDLSNVARPADRIARYLQYRFGPEDGLAKAASADLPTITGGDWAEFEGVNLPAIDFKHDLRRQSLLTKLAAMEKEIAGAGGGLDPLTQMKEVAAKAFATASDFADIDRLRAERPQAAFAKLARARVLLPFPEFCAYITGMPQAEFGASRVYKKAAAQLPGIFGDMEISGIQAPDDFSAGAMDLMDVGSCSCDPLQPALDRMVEKYHCQSGPVKNRVLGSEDKNKAPEKPDENGHDEGGDGEKSAAENNAARRLAHCYGLYKLSALSDMSRFHGDDDFRAIIAVAHNFAAHR